eukprot:TRINITY_DN6437_c1_g1_i1.p1 TRINITY_DN6437_c1_g1~~TRINITY_DN6437_c1_g1_i1.p1  ORF type:complete len:1007 (-),score=355.63 TRINITY_DN6437_c1_g1_i1:282-3302(-)
MSTSRGARETTISLDEMGLLMGGGRARPVSGSSSDDRLSSDDGSSSDTSKKRRSGKSSSVRDEDVMDMALSRIMEGGGRRGASGTETEPAAADEEDAPGSNFKVVIRVRPPLPRELSSGFTNVLKVDLRTHRVITISENFGVGDEMDGIYNAYQFTFDYVYDEPSKQDEVYNRTAKAAVMSTLEGYNATIFAYGQTGTGKTYTMEGKLNSSECGIIPRATEEIFDFIQNCVDPKNRFLVRASYLQIYNEVISDLLKPERRNLQIREDKKRGVFVEGLSEWVVRSPQEVYGLMQRGGSVRATGTTRMNELSSRSHAIFLIIVEQAQALGDGEVPPETEESSGEAPRSPGSGETHVLFKSFKIGKLNLVDLAGSERVRYSGATGVRLEESKKINQSLSALGNVIAALTDQRGRTHIPYRDSKLTRILEDSLGGNCKTTMMAMVSPAMDSFGESLSTLKFANRAKNIKNVAHVNEDLNERALIRKYERELKALRTELQQKSRDVVDKRRLLELEEQKRRAEEDKLAAITALEKRSREFMMEKEQKRKLEERIMMMQSQLLIGGITVEDTPQFRSALQEEYKRVHRQYEDRLAALEKERESIEEDKAQVDRYKQLLLKQRDIMIALTARLNERDETILALQEELDAYDHRQRLLEDALDQKTATLIHLQRVAMEHHAISPLKSPQLAHALGLKGEQAAALSGNGSAFSPVHYHPRGEPNVVMSPRGGSDVDEDEEPEIMEGEDAEDAARHRGDHGSGERGDGSSRRGSGKRQHGAKSARHETAEERVFRLTSMLETKEIEVEQMRQVLDDVQAEKVALESILREQQSQQVDAGDGKIDGSAKSFPSVDQFEAMRKQMEQLQGEVERRNEEIRRLRQSSGGYPGLERGDKSGRSVTSTPSTDEYEQKIGDLEKELRMSDALRRSEKVAHDREVDEMRTQIRTNDREREALITILGVKIKGLAENISTKLADVRLGGEKMSISRDLTALQKLVNASVLAMKSSQSQRKDTSR